MYNVLEMNLPLKAVLQMDGEYTAVTTNMMLESSATVSQKYSENLKG